MMDGERYYASFPDENRAGPSSELVSRVLLNTLVAFERQRGVSEQAPVEDVELRRVLGCWLKRLREARGLSQRRSYDPAIYRLLFDKECCKEKAQSL